MPTVSLAPKAVSEMYGKKRNLANPAARAKAKATPKKKGKGGDGQGKGGGGGGGQDGGRKQQRPEQPQDPSGSGGGKQGGYCFALLAGNCPLGDECKRRHPGPGELGALKRTLSTDKPPDQGADERPSGRGRGGGKGGMG